MAKIILSGKIYTSTAPNHISYTNQEYSHTAGGGCAATDEFGNCVSWYPTYPVYNYPTRYVDAKINGTITSTVSNVYINGSKPVTANGDARETDTYTLPPTATTGGSGAHTNIAGRMTGNNKNVYVNGNLLVTGGSSLITHASTSVTLDTSSTSSNVNIG